ncbi:MAG: hypothetical protein HY928_08640 [Elusimicrobia bacterium]|nr:hypothetical protein [Elusimicrobiota bacterium]
MTTSVRGALHTPSAKDMRALEEKTSAFQSLKNELETDAIRLIALKRKSGFFSSGQYDLSSFSSAEVEEISAKSRSAANKRRMLRILASELTALAQTSYGISNPSKPLSGTILSGPPSRPGIPEAMESFIGNTGTFGPIFDPSLPSGTVAHTDNAGLVRIGWAAFSYPGKLGHAIFHEQQHFKDLLTPNRDLRNDAAIELRIRSAQRVAAANVFQLTAEDMTRYDSAIAGLPAAAREWDNRIAEGFDPYRKDHWVEVFKPIISKRLPLETAGPASGGSDFLDRLGDIQAGAEELARAVVEEQRHRADLAGYFRDRRERETAHQAQEAALESLRSWTEAACSRWDGSHFADLAFDWERWRDAHLQALGRQSVPVDLSIFTPQQRFSCTDFFTNQVQVRKARGETDFSLGAAFSLIEESRRVADSRPPTGAHAEPAPPPVRHPQPPVVVPGDGSGAQPPPIPRCRYQGDWCKE